MRTGCGDSIQAALPAPCGRRTEVTIRSNDLSRASRTASPAMPDQYHLQRFVDAQEPVFAQVVTELQAGCKIGHWMWFIFPQLRGLGSSPMASRFAIGGLGEAQAYLHHPILGSRLGECTRLTIQANRLSVTEIFGYPDNLKFHSSMTLFLHAGSNDGVFRQALDKYFGGAPDPLTLERL
jgi:uncharacterized protein (DUF1810 family)